MNARFSRFVGIGFGTVLLVSVISGCKSHAPEAEEEGRVCSKTMVVTSAPIPVQVQAQSKPPQPPTQPARTEEALFRMSPQDALAELQAGNARFVSGHMRLRNLPQEVRATADHQYPFAVIVSCIDSRVSAELVFDQGMGDVFNARVAGNVLNDDIVGSLEFACKVTGAKLIVVLGHSNCGAIKGAIDNVQLGKLTGLVAKIKPAEDMVPQDVQPRTSKNHDLVERVATNNVQLVMRQIRLQSPVLRQMLDAGKIGLVGGMYDLGTGDVRFMPK